MMKIAVERASAHLGNAERFASALPKVESFAEFEVMWVGFLTEYGRFRSKLEKGVKSDPVSRQWWFGTVKNNWRKDALMSYLYQARNVSEHGLEDVTRRAADAGRIRFPATKEVKFGAWMRINSDGSFDVKDPVVTTPDGEFKNLELWNARVELAAVRDDRYKDEEWAPPTTHLGKPIADRSPSGVAALALAEMRAVLAEAVTRMK